MSKSRHYLDLFRTMHNVELVRAISTTICSSLKLTDPLVVELLCTRSDTNTHKHTSTQTDGDEYTLVGVDKPQLQL